MIEFAQNFATAVWALKYVLLFLLVVGFLAVKVAGLETIDEDQIK